MLDWLMPFALLRLDFGGGGGPAPPPPAPPAAPPAKRDAAQQVGRRLSVRRPRGVEDNILTGGSPFASASIKTLLGE